MSKATGEADLQLLPAFSHVGPRHPEAHARCWVALFASINHQFHRLGMTLNLLLLLEESGVSSWMKWTIFCSSLCVLQWARCTITLSCFRPTQLNTAQKITNPDKCSEDVNIWSSWYRLHVERSWDKAPSLLVSVNRLLINLFLAPNNTF